METSNSNKGVKAVILIKQIVKKVQRKVGKNASYERIYQVAKEETKHVMDKIAQEQIHVQSSFEDPDPVFKNCLAEPLAEPFFHLDFDYRPCDPMLTGIDHFSLWMLDIYLGNYTRFMEMVKMMGEEELNQHLNMRETLYQRGALFHVLIGMSLVIPGKSGYSVAQAVHSTVEAEHMKILEKLLELGADPNVHDIFGCIPLGLCGSAPAKLLIQHGADVNAMHGLGMRVLTSFVMQDQEDIVRLLLKHGANPYLNDRLGLNVFDFAIKIPKVNGQLLRLHKSEILKEQRRQNYKKCGECFKISSKRCGGCLMEFYCNIDCQRKHWEQHQSICRERRDQYFPVKFESYPTLPGFNADRFNANRFNAKNEFVLSVQLLSFSDTCMHVYERKLRFSGKLCNDGNGSKLKKIIKEEGFKGFKGCFYARKDGNQLKIHPKMLPPQLW